MRRLRSLSKIYKCKMFTFAMQKWLGLIGLVLGVVERDKVSSPCLYSNLWDGSALHGYKCTSDICLRTCRGHSSHSSEVSVCRGPGPIPESPVQTSSHLSTCEILHTSHNWSMTVSANCIRCFSTCFLHRLYGFLY